MQIADGSNMAVDNSLCKLTKISFVLVYMSVSIYLIYNLSNADEKFFRQSLIAKKLISTIPSNVWRDSQTAEYYSIDQLAPCIYLSQHTSISRRALSIVYPI